VGKKVTREIRDAIRADRKSNMTLKALAEKYKLVPSTIWRMCRFIPVNMSRKLTQEFSDKVFRERQKGTTFEALGKKFKIRAKTASYICHGRGIDVHGAPRKMTPALIEKIRAERKLGTKLTVIAQDYDLAFSTVSKYCRDIRLDLRVHLTPDQKERIVTLAREGISHAAIRREFAPASASNIRRVLQAQGLGHPRSGRPRRG